MEINLLIWIVTTAAFFEIKALNINFIFNFRNHECKTEVIKLLNNARFTYI